MGEGAGGNDIMALCKVIVPSPPSLAAITPWSGGRGRELKASEESTVGGWIRQQVNDSGPA